MSYVGNSHPQLLFAPGTRDDLIPSPATNKVTFELSQEVPGGYEGNVFVMRRKFLTNELCNSNNDVSLDSLTNSLSTVDPVLASVLSSVVSGQNIKILGAATASNNGIKKVLSVVYTPGGSTSSCIIIFDPTTPITANEGPGVALTLIQAYDGPWEVLQPEVDYIIEGVGLQYNKLITFPYILQEEDVSYVIHKGEATYNFVPTQNSVGPDQLQENLRNFQADHFVGDNIQTDFVLSQTAVSSKSLLVYIDGIIQVPIDSVYLTGDYELLSDDITIQFTTAPGLSSKITVLHLGFSTISRRAALSDGQIGSVGIDGVNTPSLQNGCVTEPKLATNSVSTNKIQNDAINSSKILLQYGEFLRSKDLPGTGTINTIGTFGTNQTKVDTNTTFHVFINGSQQFNFSNTEVSPETTNTLSLGTTLKRFKDLFLSGNSEVLGNSHVVQDLTVDQNINVSGLVDGVDVSSLNTQVQSLIFSGAILMTARSTAPSGWLLCDGSVVSQTTYSTLYSAIGSSYNTGGEGAGNFRLPDLRQKFALGKATSGTGSVLGEYGGAIDHNHSLPSHTHDITHTHTVPGHYHSHNTSIGSNLNIVSSGNHNTDLAHSHTNSITSNSEGLHTHTINPSPPGLLTAGLVPLTTDTNATSLSHNHSISPDAYSTSNTNLSHVHNIYRTQSPSATHGHTHGNFGFASSPTNESGAADLWPTGIPDINMDHSHIIPSMTTTSEGPSGVLNHIHNIAPHSHNVYGTIPSNSSTHQHTITVNPVPSGTFSASNGSHNHTTASFSGSLGNVNSGLDGNSSLTTATQSNNTSGSSSVLASGLSNPPFCVVNYLIKT